MSNIPEVDIYIYIYEGWTNDGNERAEEDGGKVKVGQGQGGK